MKKVNHNKSSASVNLRVIGIGGSGGNAVNHMIEQKIKGVEFIVINTDEQDLQKSMAKTTLAIGKQITHGFGTGMDPEVGRSAAEESKEEIKQLLQGSDMLFIACGMGGGTGTGAAPVVGRIAKEMGILTVAIVTKPFSFERKKRAEIAEVGIRNLSPNTDAYITIPNDNLIDFVDAKTSIRKAFKVCDSILYNAVSSISSLITTPGMINTDFADVRRILANSGRAVIGIGEASGSLDRAEHAALKAISSPLIDLPIDGAKKLLYTISGRTDLGMLEVEKASQLITSKVNPDADIIFGTLINQKLPAKSVAVTVIASAFDSKGNEGSNSTFGAFNITKGHQQKDNVIRIQNIDDEHDTSHNETSQSSSFAEDTTSKSSTTKKLFPSFFKK